ncbi:sigma 54-interacting transcriptional regulator [Thauera mechernichensis]|uniref:Sigma 54-interacting transcriptional regulator n=1 Tax=Thauera mechernichensis TaxID=82788 RepID=A0ABW3WCP2_9RHOO|nr:MULTISPECIES: sigma-54-dependent Fis family transcriptional regulator [Thauera]ENO79350.1 Fis family transcriptional regulator [Thauera sp. 27]MDG3066987.1 sigma 54-interacting transcriptional regulator [Thauera mechernichensis]WBL63038.1 sigma 54-interacting transcriptional regulator [Thauera sp. WB-2]HAG74177.1 sigma-54-dependent Fis family transcriptional regulator [Thauera sp.]HNR61636.1 sigma 54-interacting transcriptional regulator [Thauera sp.]
MSSIHYPESTDLRGLLKFAPEEGLIWLGEHRMLLLHAGALSELRKELIASVGQEQARRILTRMGFASGMRDAELSRRTRGSADPAEAFVMGPQLHMLEGCARVEPVRLEINQPGCTFYGEFIWHHSWEAEAHVQAFGEVENPVCWMMIGYASGYTSAFMGRFILFREVECAATGVEHCRIVGKPVEEWPDADQLRPYFEADSIVGRLLELREEIEAMRRTIACPRKTPDLIGNSAGFLHAYDLVARAAVTNVSVLLLGETGVGKERFARTLHELSPRKDAAFVAVNCAALPDELIESELFGVERGAFTGAHASRAGKFERADGGTLFLDEVGELPLSAQAKLLRVLQEGEIERLGDERTRKVNVRLVAATNVDLLRAVNAGTFRRDLFYRLNVYPVTIPPLRERVGDIPTLVEAMMRRFETLHGKRLSGISDKAMHALKNHSWPGNVRELENVIERGVILAPLNGLVEVEHLFIGAAPESGLQQQLNASGSLDTMQQTNSIDLPDAVLDSGIELDAFEQALLNRAVERAGGNLSAAARLLGMTRPQLNYRLKKRLC